MGWKIRARKRTKVGPLTFNWNPLRLLALRNPVTSTTAKVGWFSRNSRRPDVTRVDLPYGFHAEHRSDER